MCLTHSNASCKSNLNGNNCIFGTKAANKLSSIPFVIEIDLLVFFLAQYYDIFWSIHQRENFMFILVTSIYLNLKPLPMTMNRNHWHIARFVAKATTDDESAQCSYQLIHIDVYIYKNFHICSSLIAVDTFFGGYASHVNDLIDIWTKIILSSMCYPCIWWIFFNLSSNDFSQYLDYFW